MIELHHRAVAEQPQFVGGRFFRCAVQAFQLRLYVEGDGLRQDEGPFPWTGRFIVSAARLGRPCENRTGLGRDTETGAGGR